MAAPFIFIGTHSVKEGKLEDFKRYAQEFCAFIQAQEPRLIHFALYVNEDDSDVTVVQVHPDAESMVYHMQVAAEHFVHAYELLDATKSLQIYGAPSDALVEQMKQVAGPGVPVIVRSQFAGFNRLPVAAV